MSARPQWIVAGVAALAFAGTALVAWSGRTTTTASSPPSGSDPHAAAGVVVGSGLQVAAAFTERVAALAARVQAAPDDRAALLELAQLLHDGHRTAEALPHYRRAIELQPEDAQPYYDLASAYASLASWEEARGVLRKRLAIAPADAIAMYDLGAVEANAGNEDEAAAWWRRARDETVDAGLRARIDGSLSRLADDFDPPRPK